MSRLYDKARPCLIDKYEDYANAVIVDFNNVFNYFNKWMAEKDFLIPDNIPIAKPPFQFMFLEANYFQENSNNDVGIFIVSNPLENGISKHAACFYANNTPDIMAAFEYWTNSAGQMIRINESDYGGYIRIWESEYCKNIVSKGKHFEMAKDVAFLTFAASLLAISFMHCKNVTMSEHNPKDIKPKKPIRDMRGYLKKRIPQTKYYTLDIEPMKKVLKSEGNIDEVGLQRALHICRGHFKDYSKGNGLFGKYKGLYWWDSTVRGSEEAGRIEKDYNIKL